LGAVFEKFFTLQAVDQNAKTLAPPASVLTISEAEITSRPPPLNRAKRIVQFQLAWRGERHVTSSTACAAIDGTCAILASLLRLHSHGVRFQPSAQGYLTITWSSRGKAAKPAWVQNRMPQNYA
jgi:hypothetical protein